MAMDLIMLILEFSMGKKFAGSYESAELISNYC